MREKACERVQPATHSQGQDSGSHAVSVYLSWLIKNGSKRGSVTELASGRGRISQGRPAPGDPHHKTLLVFELVLELPMFHGMRSKISLLYPLHRHHSSLGLVLPTISAARLRHSSLVLKIYESELDISQSLLTAILLQSLTLSPPSFHPVGFQSQ